MAGIPRRIGYHQNFSFLLTDSIENTKHEGRKHEKDYNLDMLEILGVPPVGNGLHFPVDEREKVYVDDLLGKRGVKKAERIVVIHPGASCASKIWPVERFAKLADRLIELYGVKVVVIGGRDKRDLFCVDSVRKFVQKDVIFAAEDFNIRQLGPLFERSKLFISNDSGPVHIAVAVKTPSVVLFGRRQPGLSPVRWGPLGPKDAVIHKDVGCAGICLAHNCKQGFECLRSISVEDVLNAINQMNVL